MEMERERGGGRGGGKGGIERVRERERERGITGKQSYILYMYM